MNPSDLQARLGKAHQLMAQGDLGGATKLLEAVLREAPGEPNTLHMLAAVKQRASDHGSALRYFDEATRRAPNAAPFHFNRANLLFEMGRYGDALVAYERSLQLRPDHGDAHFNRGRVLQELDRLPEALAAYDRAVALDPKNAAVQHNRAVLLMWLGRRDEAMVAFGASLAQRPSHVDTLYTKGVAHLAFAELAEGWRLHALRRAPGSPIAIEDLSRGEPEWNGERVGVLRLWREQGVGDEVLFARLAQRASALADRVVIECGARLVPLFARSFPELDVYAAGEAPPADAQCPMGGVGQFVAPDTAALGAGAPYLHADEQRRDALRAHYAERARGRPIIGIAWSSNNQRLRSYKSASLLDWGALLQRDCLFVNLQYGDAAAEVETARAKIGADIITDPDVDQMANLDDFAAQVASMDAIVSISNTTVHFAGALGVPCLTLVPPAQGLLWYWGATGETTPWYESVRIVRRSPGERWAEQVARAASLLDQRLGGALQAAW